MFLFAIVDCDFTEIEWLLFLIFLILLINTFYLTLFVFKPYFYLS